MYSYMHAHVLIHHTRTTNTPHTNVIDYTHIHIHMYTSLIHTYIDTHTTILYTLHCTYILIYSYTTHAYSTYIYAHTYIPPMHTWYTYALISYSIPI